jgi:Tol biopolymer transport system component
MAAPSFPGAPTTGRVAPSNALLASTASALANGPFYVLDRTSGASRQLSLEGGRAVWSPDGTRMAFSRSEPTELWVAAADGSDASRLASFGGVIRHLTWSPDNGRIFFAQSQGFMAGGLQQIAAAGGSPEEVLPASEGVELPEVSGDGRSLAYFRAGSVTELKIVDLGTGQTRTLASDPNGRWNVTGLAWTRDGQSLLVSSSDLDGRMFQIERVDVASGNREPLGAAVDYYLTSFTATPDGSRVLMLAFPRDRGSPDPSRAWEIWLVDPATGGREPLATDRSVTPQSIHASPTR